MKCYYFPVLTLQDMAEIVGVPVPQLRLWLKAGKIIASRTEKNTQVMLGSGTDYFFTEKDIEPIRKFAKKNAPEKKGLADKILTPGDARRPRRPKRHIKSHTRATEPAKRAA